jgi:hypothetical protein
VLSALLHVLPRIEHVMTRNGALTVGCSLAITDVDGVMGALLDLPTPLALDGERSVTSTVGAAFLEGCLVVRLRIDLVDLCGLAQAGALRAVSAFGDGSTPVLAPLVTVGSSVAVRVPLWAGLGAFVRAGLDLPVVGAQFSFDDDVIFESAPFAGPLSVGLSGLALWQGEGP